MYLQLVLGKDVTEKDIEQAVYLDQLSYDESYRGKLDDCIAWSKSNPNIYLMIRDLDTNHIIAYVNIMPVTNECYNKIKSGNFIDIEITPQMILQQSENIYISSVVIDPFYRCYYVCKFLLDAIENKLTSMKIKRILADAITPIGEKVCKHINMVKILDSKHNSVIYEKVM